MRTYQFEAYTRDGGKFVFQCVANNRTEATLEGLRTANQKRAKLTREETVCFPVWGVDAPEDCVRVRHPGSVSCTCEGHK